MKLMKLENVSYLITFSNLKQNELDKFQTLEKVKRHEKNKET